MVAGEKSCEIRLGKTIFVQDFISNRWYLNFAHHRAPVGHVMSELADCNLFFLGWRMCDDADSADVVKMHDTFAMGLCRKVEQEVALVVISNTIYRVHSLGVLESLKVVRCSGEGPYCAKAA